MGQSLVEVAERARRSGAADLGVGVRRLPQLWEPSSRPASSGWSVPIALYDREQHRGLAYVYGENPGVASRVYAATARPGTSDRPIARCA